MYCLRVLLLFYRNYMYMYIVCYSVYCDYFGVLIDCCVSELHAKLCPHQCNVCKFRCLLLLVSEIAKCIA